MASRCRRAVVALGVLAIICGCLCSATSSAAALSPEEQQLRAELLYRQLIDADSQDFPAIIRLLNEVIERCPDTERAQESVWRLSNLYLMAYDKPDYPKVIELMRYLLARYPTSPLVSHAKQRLLRAYEDTGNYDGARVLYEEALSLNPELEKQPEYAAFLLGYAKALGATGKPEQARLLYQRVVDFGKQIEDWLRAIAVDALDAQH